MAKKSKEPPLPPPVSLSSSSSHSFSEESSPPPAVSHAKKSSASSTMAVLPKGTELYSKHVNSEEEDEEEGSESEEESTGKEHSEYSEPAGANPNPPSQMQESRNTGGMRRSPSPDSDSEDEDVDGNETDSRSESEQQQPRPLAHASVNTGGSKSTAIMSCSESASEDGSQNSSDSDVAGPPIRSSSRNIAGPSLKPLSSKPMDTPPLHADQNTIPAKRSATPLGQNSEKKRKTAIVETERVQEKKEISRKCWSKEDELSLLQSLLDYKENHHSVPCSETQLQSLLEVLNDSLSSPVTLNHLHSKIRSLRRKYSDTTRRLKGTKNPKFSNDHDASIFDKLKKIWAPGTQDVVAFDKLKSNENDSRLIDHKIKAEVMENSMRIKGKATNFALDYPFLRWHVKSEHPNIALVHGDHLHTAEVIELEGSCKKLELTEIQLHMKKIKLLPSALKLIEFALLKS